MEGTGYTQIGDQRLDWQPKDVFCVPSWASHQHVNASGAEPAFLFSFSDAPVQRALGLLREGV